MTAVTVDRATQTRVLTSMRIPVLAAEHIYAGALVGITAAGYLANVTAITTLRILGKAMENVDNTDGASADLYCKVEPGIHKWANGSGADEITFDDIGLTCYGADNATVAIVSTSRSVAGRVVGVDADGGVWVFSTPLASPVTDGDLVAANNLSDVAAAATARANIGAHRHFVNMQITDLIAANTFAAYYVHAGPSATLIDIRSRLSAALATGNATITFAISTDGVTFTAVTNGVVTITQAASAAGDLDSATPSAANVIAEGNVLRAIVGGTNTGAAAAAVGIEFTV